MKKEAKPYRLEHSNATYDRLSAVAPLPWTARGWAIKGELLDILTKFHE